MGNAIVDITRDYSDDTKFNSAKLSAIIDELETAFLYVKNNLDQLKVDILPSSYTFDDDGSANLTNKIYNKQIASDTYTSDISLGTSTDASFGDVDATNAALVFTPEIAGYYEVTFNFCVEMIPTSGNQIDIAQYFRLTDSASSPNLSSPLVLSFDPKANDANAIIPVSISHIFNFTAAEQTIKLQNRVVTATNIDTNSLKGSSGLYELYMFARKI